MGHISHLGLVMVSLCSVVGGVQAGAVPIVVTASPTVILLPVIGVVRGGSPVLVLLVALIVPSRLAVVVLGPLWLPNESLTRSVPQ